MIVYCVKAKELTKKRWSFITSKGGVNNLRIHAAQFFDKVKADGLAQDINESNPGEWEARVEVFAQDTVKP